MSVVTALHLLGRVLSLGFQTVLLFLFISFSSVVVQDKNRRNIVRERAGCVCVCVWEGGGGRQTDRQADRQTDKPRQTPDTHRQRCKEEKTVSFPSTALRLQREGEEGGRGGGGDRQADKQTDKTETETDRDAKR